MSITFLHTAKVHSATFDKMSEISGAGTQMTHHVREKWLKRAQRGVDAVLEVEIAALVGSVEGPVICTCTTLGLAAEKAGAIRVDWPMMQAAAQAGGAVMLVYCLDSTWEPSLTLLERALQEEGTPQKVYPLNLSQYWPLFEAGEQEAFAAVLAGEVRQAAEQVKDLSAIVLAQVSMAGAAPLLSDMAVPVLSSPELALRAAFAQT